MHLLVHLVMMIVTMNVLILIHYIIYNFFFKAKVLNCIIKMGCYCGKERFCSL